VQESINVHPKSQKHQNSKNTKTQKTPKLKKQQSNNSEWRASSRKTRGFDLKKKERPKREIDWREQRVGRNSNENGER